MKFETEHVIEALKESKINQDEIDVVVGKLQEIADELAKEKALNRVRRPKKKLVLLHIIDTNSYYVMQAELTDDLSQTTARLQKSIGDYNQSAKKKKVEIKNFADAIEFIPNKILKDNDLIIKTKVPCEIKDIPRVSV